MWHSFQLVWFCLRGQRLQYFASLGALVLATLFMYLVFVFPQIVLDGVLASHPEKASGFVQRSVQMLGGADWLRHHLWWPASLLIAVSVLAGYFTYLRGKWSAQASELLTRNLRDRVYLHLQQLPCRYYDQAETGDLLQRCTSDVETLRVFLSTQVLEIGRAIVLLLAPLPLMIAIHPGMTLVSVLLLPVIFFFSLLYFTRIRGIFQETEEAEASMTSTLQDNLAGIRVVRAFARQEFEKQKFRDKNILHRDVHNKLYHLLANFWAISDFLCMIQQIAVLGFGTYWMAQGSLQIGAFFFFLAAVNLFLWPIRMMGRILAELSKATVAIERLFDILKQPNENGVSAVDFAATSSQPMETVPTINKPRKIHKQQEEQNIGNDTTSVITLPRNMYVAKPCESSSDENLTSVGDWTCRGDIRFENVSFRYGEEQVLHGISFHLKPGQTMALVGPSGSGKSTIIQLLLRLYEPTTGRILLDGCDIQSLPRETVRSQVATVLQEPFLYSKTVYKNIHLAAPHAEDMDVYEAAKMARIHETITAFDDGYETMVGEKGITLSGGQRQRTALARALLRQTPILVLDDALSAVDTETEAHILQTLHQQGRTQTTIMVAHRLSTLMHADQILVLAQGQIVQVGRHSSLVQQSGLYQQLWELQQSVEVSEERATAIELFQHKGNMRITQ